MGRHQRPHRLIGCDWVDLTLSRVTVLRIQGNEVQWGAVHCSTVHGYRPGWVITLGVAVAVSAIMGTPGKQPEVTTPTCL
jgi:hypothetical protein